MTKESKQFLYFTMIHIVAFSLLMFLSGCSTANKTMGFSGLIGASTGAVLGGIADPGKDGEYRTRNVIVGGYLGGLTGLVVGSAVHKEMEAQKKEAFLKGKASNPPQQSGMVPTITQAKVRTEWIESRTSGNRFIDGHFEYVIEEPSRWETSK